MKLSEIVGFVGKNLVSVSNGYGYICKITIKIFFEAYKKGGGGGGGGREGWLKSPQPQLLRGPWGVPKLQRRDPS